jgi:anti-sigma-K factor RskA
MMDNFTAEALQYLLGELEPERRAAFEARLVRDPVAASVLKSCAEALAGFSSEGAAAAPLTAAERLEMKSVVLAAAADFVPPTSAARERPGWPAWVWPAAAGLLFLANLWQLSRSHPAPAGRQQPPTEQGAVAALPARDAGRLTAPANAVGFRADQAGLATAPRDGLPPAPARAEALRTEILTLQARRDQVAKEYQSLLAGLAQASAAGGGASGKIVTMELVDGATYASGNRNGPVSTALSTLTTPGIVALAPLNAPVSPGPGNVAIAESGTQLTAAGVASLTGSPGSISVSSGTLASEAASLDSLLLSTASLSSAGANGTVSAAGGSALTLTAAGGSVPTAPSAPAAAGSLAPPVDSASAVPYAWSVFDEGEQQGYLNLYNLPQVSAGQAMQLWILPQGATSFQWIGQVPDQFYGQSGSVLYKLAPNAAAPSQLLITIEPSGTTPVVPTGPTVLRGP